MSNQYIDKELGCPVVDPFQQILDKIDRMSYEIELLKQLMGVKEIVGKAREELLGDLDYMILTQQTMSEEHLRKPATGYDHLSLMILISSLFKAS